MGKMDRMPRLEDLSRRTRARPPARESQTWEQQRDIGRMYTLMLGGAVTERKQIA
jgi:hypothetical protein